MQKIVFIILFSLIFADLTAEEYFLTLRNDKVNLRQGPSFEYPIKLFYKKKFLPVLVQDKFTDSWCKVKVSNYKGWIKKDSLWGLL